ncbi:VCBS domain-containing protein [Aliivibrio finisterrensis]|uniref:VCBS domain-containing protein n=1 Tax=Aliivibrio finisterrensis TaxID=511998 RepID=UPI001FCB5CF9|nr:VCBS domain-containing protein [Aliivibrio finisterrensis]
MNKQSEKNNSNNKAESLLNSEKEKSPFKHKKNKSQTYLAKRLSQYPQLMLILPSFSLSQTLTSEDNIEEKDSNIESGTLDVSNSHHNESLISPLAPIVENKMSNIQPNQDDANEHTPMATPSARSSSHLASHAITPIVILPTPVQNHTINQAPAMLVTPPTTLSTPPLQHSQQQAIISGKDSATTTEDVTTHVAGKLTVIDPDLGEAHFSNTDISGSLGTLHLTNSGAWTYDLDNTNPRVQALGKGATATDTITVHSADGTPHHVTITVNGTNDKAVIAGIDSGAVTEESQLHTSGTLTVTDVDTGEAHFSNSNIIGTLGTLHLTDSGAWTYDLDNTNPTVQALGKGSTATDTITVHSADGTPHQVTITVNGTNDNAVIGSSNTGAVTEETQLHTSGTLSVTDVDTGEAHFSNSNIIGTLGTLHLTDSGAWTYDLNNTNPTVQTLGKGSTATDTITIHSADGTPHQVTITVNGTNDKAVIGGSNTGAVTEESQLQTSGTLTVTDVDTGEAHFTTSSTGSIDIAGTLGTLHLTDNGAWTYDLDNTNPTVQALDKGSTATDSITVHSADGTPHQVTITVNGTNDKAVIGGSNTGAVTEESQLHTSGTLTVTDVDTGEARFTTSSTGSIDITGTLGTLHLTDNGAWTYDLDNTNPTVQALGKGATATDTIAVHSADGTPYQVTITINGTDDKAVIGGTNTGAVTEESQLQTSGTLTVTDVDTGEAHFSNSNVQGTFGTLHLTDSGSWTYDLDNTNPKVQALGQGKTATDTITVQSADGTTHQMTITVNGTNDKAVITGTNVGVVTEESQLHTSGRLTVTDVDTGEAHFSNSNIIGTLGTLHLTDNGSWTYDLDNSNPTVQALGQGQQVKDIITVQSADGTPHQIAIVVNGRNDAAVITGTTTGAVTEDRINGMQWLLTDGKMHVSDSDSGEAKFDPVIHAHNYAGIGYTSILGAEVIVTPDGDWHYQLDNNIQQVQSLGQGQSYVDKVTVHTVDGTTQELQITITGTNDNPTVTGSRVLPAGSEDQTLHITQTQLLAGASDIDKNDASTLYVDAVTADHGTVTHNTDGSFTFHPDKDYNGQVHFTYDVKDAHGGSAQATASTMLTATSDSAIISEVSTDHVTEDGPHSRHNAGVTTELANGRLQVVDPDSGEDKFQYSQFGETAIHDPFGGMLRIDSMGNWGYSVNNANLQHLAEGQTETVVYRVHSYDGTAYELHINVVGTNDAPTVTQVALSNGTEDTHYQMQASQFGFSDIDTGDTLHSIAITDLPLATQGKFVLDGHDVTSGQQIPTADISKLQFVPAQDFNGDVQFKYTVNDGHTDSTEATNTLHIDAVGDVAVVTGVDIGDVHEGHGYTAPDGSMSVGSVDDRSPDYMHGNIGKLWNDEIHTDGHLSIVDADAGESQAQTGTYYGTHGRVILQTNGDWSYFASIGQDATGRAIDHLGKGESLTDTVTVKSADGTTHDIVITIHGDNDRPYCSGEVQLNSGKEDLAQTITASELLANTIDVDTNDIGKLTITNLHADHGSVLDNHDGTYTFTPSKDYNGQVHFTYDVQDAHGGVTATGATLQLVAVSDAAQIIAAGVTLKEDHVLSGTTSLHSEGQFHVIDPDGPSESQFAMAPGQITSFYKGSFGGDLQINSNGNYFYNIDNSTVDHLRDGEHVTDRFTIKSVDGTTKEIEFVIQGTSDTPTIARSSLHEFSFEDGSVLHGSLYGLDPDKGDKQTLTYEALGSAAGFHLDPDGSYTFDPSNSAYQHASLTYGSDLQIYVPVKVTDSEGLLSVHNMRFTVMPTNDVPIVTSSVSLSSGTEDHSVVLHSRELLAHASDVDDYDRLHISNLHADHGSIADNHDGTFTFTPNSNYNGAVKFSYDVTDNHGASTHTSASMTLAAVEDKTEFIGANHGVATEDIRTPMSTNVSLLDAVDWQALQITDVDSPNTQVTVEFAGKQYTWDLGSDLDVTTPYGKFQFHTIASGPHQGEHSWSYIGDNNNVHVQELKHGESLTESIKLIATDGTEFPITVKVYGTEDGVVIDSKSELGHVVENAQTGASVSGNVVAHDVDLHDTVSWTQTPTGGISGQYGTFHLSTDGQWHYDVDQSKATKLGDGDEYWEHFTVEAVSTDGSHVSKSVSVVVHGNNDVPTVSGEVTLPSGNEDTSIHITQAQLVANAIDVDANDRGWLHVENLTADHGSLVSNSDGSFTFNPDPNYNGTVHFTYDVADRHGGIAHTGANTTLAAVNDAAVFSGVDTGSVTEDHNVHASVQGNYSYKLETSGTLTATDTDTGESGFDFRTLITASTHPEWAPYRSKLGGQLEIDQHGNWNYYIDNRKPEVQGLGAGETLTDTVTIHSKDGTPYVITVTIQGTNDAPILGVNQTSSTTGTLTETDVDVTDSHTFSVVSSAGQFGSLSVDPTTGDYVYTPNTSIAGMSYNSATNTYHGVDVFEIKVSDGHTEDSKFITFDASGHVTMSPTGSLTTSTTVPQQPTVTTTLPTLLMVNTVAPTNTVTLDLASTSDSGSSNTDNLTNDATPTITGHTDIPYSQVTVYDGSTPVGHAVSDAFGQYSVAVSSLSDGDHNLSAKALAPSSGLPATSSLLSVHIDTQVSVPTITFENAGADNLYNKAEIARGHANTITATVTPPGDAKIGEHLVVNGQDHVLDAHTLQHGIQIEVHPGSNVQATMTDEHGNAAGSQGFAASAIPEPIIVRPPSGSHQVSGTLGVPPLLPSLTPVPTAQSGWRIHLPNGQYVTSHHGQYGTLTIDPQTGHLHYQEQAQVHTGPHGSASGVGQHEDKFEVALQGTNQDEVVAHVNVQILSHGPGNSGKLTIGTEVVDMTITPVAHASHPAPPPPPVQHDEPDMTSQADFTVTLSDDSYLDLTQHAHHEPDQQNSHHGAAAYLDVLGIKPDTASTTVHDQPTDMDIVLAQVDQSDATTHDQAHLDMSDALEHHDTNINHNQDDEHHHHNDIDGLPDIDPNS